MQDCDSNQVDVNFSNHELLTWGILFLKMG